ncbi:uncharacterized protein LOC120354713 [Nilaparvata lugens]|uniref:uncharacterized protein LOC120354713 n=1 Tax=Nilaparvata lugens TaxID=108931 RepID=UPI00193C8A2D|nr:uncharacterized protein LOC120354713 [Nilaparvata lugens]
MLQQGPKTLLVLLCELFRASLAYGYIPQAWCLSRVVFIPKRGRADYSTAKSFCPINLTSFLLKTLERLVERHLRKVVLPYTLLHRKQHAYQPGKSCETALHQLVSRVEASLAAREIALCAFMDIEGTFDNVTYKAMVRAVQGHGVEPAICSWAEAILCSRLIMADLQGQWREGLSGTGHCTIAKAVAHSPVLEMTSDVMSMEEEWKSEEGPHPKRGSLVWYTDGSLIEGKSGYRVYSDSPRTQVFASLGQHCNIFLAEIWGIMACAKMGIARRYCDKHIVILSDCQAALKALNSNEIKSKLVWENHKMLSRLATLNSVHLGWVPGHVGIGCNEHADELAELGSSMTFLGPEPGCGISKTTAFHIINK